MIMKLLEKGDSEKIKIELNDVWDIKYPYWYPLFDCNRQDVIAFDSEYIENSDRLEIVRNLLREHGVKNVYEFREDGVSN